MTYTQSFFQSIIYTLSEILSVSGQAHLLFMNAFFQSSADRYFFYFSVRVGVLLALIFVFQPLQLVFSMNAPSKKKKKKDSVASFRVIPYLVSCVPLLLLIPLGTVMKENVDNGVYLIFTALGLLVNGFMLRKADSFGHGGKTEKQVSLLTALQFGVGNFLSFLPGLSIIGTNYFFVAGYGLEEKQAEKYTYNLSMIAIFVSVIYCFCKAAVNGVSGHMFVVALVSIPTSFLTTYVCIYILKKINGVIIRPLCYYSWCMGLVMIVLALIK